MSMSLHWVHYATALAIINHQSSIINHQSSIINHQSSIINHQSSIINHQSNDSGQGINVATDHGLQISGDTGVLLSTFDIRHTQTEHESAWVNDAGQQQLKLGAEL